MKSKKSTDGQPSPIKKDGSLPKGEKASPSKPSKLSAAQGDLILQVAPSPESLNGRLHLAQATMNQHILQTGDLLLLQPLASASANASPGAALPAWPSSKVSAQRICYLPYRTHSLTPVDVLLDSLGSENCGAAPGQEVRLLQVPPSEVLDATECVLEPCLPNLLQLSFAFAVPLILQQTCISIHLFSLFSRPSLDPLLAGSHLLVGNFLAVRIYGRITKFRVYGLSPAGSSSRQVYKIGNRTRITLSSSSSSSSTTPSDRTPSAPVSTQTLPEDDAALVKPGGLEDHITWLEEMISLPLTSPEIFSEYGIKPAKGVLLYGPPGTGKTLLARYIARKTRSHLLVINGPDIISKYYGETESKLREIFAEARAHAPSIIFIDEIDALCPKRDEAATSLERRVVGTLLTELDGVGQAADGGVVVLAATNRRNHLDEALRRPGRFDKELEVPVPNPAARLAILTGMLAHVRHTLTAAEIADCAARAHGFVGADLQALCKEAALSAIQRWRRAHETELEAAMARLQLGTEPVAVPEGLEDDVALTRDDMAHALSVVRPSALREISLEIPKVAWTDIGGQEAVKQRLKEAVEWPLKHPDAFRRMGIRAPRGILLYGPPGCAKTLTAKALASMSGCNFLAVKGPEIFSKWVGDSERAIREIFRKARATAPSVIFFDEIDALGSKRGAGGEGGTSVTDRVLSQMLTEMDGVSSTGNEQVLVMAATNRPDILDKALLRPGRIDRILYVGPPDAAAREQIFRIHTAKTPTTLTGEDYIKLAAATEGFSGAEVTAVCREAAMCAMREDQEAQTVELRHFEQAVHKLSPQITQEMLDFYRRFKEQTLLQSI